MKSVILVHGINGIPKMYEWLKGELEKQNVKVILPSFPPQEGTIYEDWANILDGYEKDISEDSIVVCHSIGNEFFIRYLYKNQLRIDTYVGLAGFAEEFITDGKDVLNKAVKEFCVTKQEIENFIRSTNERYAIYSKDDHLVPINILEQYPKEIAAKPIMIPNIGHMGKHSCLEQFPELLQLVEGALSKC